MPEALRILVIDDDLQTCRLLNHVLGAEGHDAKVAHSGSAGLEAFAADAFDLVITDRAMPDMSGDDVARQIREENDSIPIVMVTGFGDLLQDTGAKPEGVDEIVGKPFTVDEIRDVIARLMAEVRE